MRVHLRRERCRRRGPPQGPKEQPSSEAAFVARTRRAVALPLWRHRAVINFVTNTQRGTLPPLLYIPGDSESLGDLSRKLAKAHGREWSRCTMGERDRWHDFSSWLIAELFRRNREMRPREELN
jgi:hypothetical protein